MGLAVGLSVDYSAHVGHNFMTKQGASNDARVAATLGDIGGAVLNGALSTFLAVCLLSLSKSYVFVVMFKEFLLTATLGVAHGLVLLPVLLSLIGPPPFAVQPHGGGDGDDTAPGSEEKAVSAEIGGASGEIELAEAESVKVIS